MSRRYKLRETGKDAEMSFEEIASKLGVTRQCVTQTYWSAMRKLKRFAAARELRELAEARRG